MSPEIEKLLKVIEQKLDWGSGETWQTRDFENLNEQILDETGVSLSASTLRRIWGRVEYKHLPSSTTLDALAKFAGFENWRVFTKNIPAPAPSIQEETGTPVQAVQAASAVTLPPAIPLQKRRRWPIIAAAAVVVIIAGIATVFAFKKPAAPINVANYSFSSKPLTRTLPNSVIFTYDATSSPTDSVYIQQSWDPATQKAVSKNEHQYTSVYYEPGFYKAKLVIGNKIVKQHDLIIPTDGWLGIIANKPVPVYLKQSDYIRDTAMGLPVVQLVKNNIPLQPNPPVVKYSNVGNFTPVPVANFSFTAQIKNGYDDGAAACEMSAIFLITNDNPIMIPLSVKGCASELNLMSVDQMVSGKKADLSGFGVDLSQWVTVACKSTSHSVQFYVNQKLAFECPQPAKPVNIVGLAFNFQGTGNVKGIQLSSKDSVVFKAF